MSSIFGFFSPHIDFSKDSQFCQNTIKLMSNALIRRGPDHQEFYFDPRGAFGHNALSCAFIHPQIPREVQPVTKTWHENSYTFLYDGYITNLPQLREQMEQDRVRTEALSQEALLLCAFLQYGPDFVKKLNGAFTIVIYDHAKNALHLFRDPLGLRPLYYTIRENTLIFASELKGLLAFPGVEAKLDRAGMNEIFSMGPAHTPGVTPFAGLWEGKPGHRLLFTASGLSDVCYHKFTLSEHTESYEDTRAHAGELLEQSIRTLLAAPETPAALLSGGLDSSVIAACMAKWGGYPKPLTTFSFDFKGSLSHFRANSFQPSLDAPYVRRMADALGSEHTTLVCGNAEQYDYLKNSVEAHDLPAMGDIDSSLLYFCEKIAPSHRIAFTGECADELFCGYPWYHRSEMYTSGTFPWATDLAPRKQLLSDAFAEELHMEEYVQAQYENACGELLPDGDFLALPASGGAPSANPLPDVDLHRKTMYLTMRFFMQTLVDRTDRAASANGMDIRVPFADFALAEYLFSVPYEMKAKNGEVKHLLREFAKGLIPEDVRTRQKSPYPKTYDPGYEALLSHALLAVVSDPNSPILAFVDPKKIAAFCQNPKDYGRPWYGQLMAGPQLMAYYLQINYWLEHYHVTIDLN
jgi:asparagine synthase (glutamine-hydrolysing)